MNKKTIKDIDWQGKKALVRVDFNCAERLRHLTDARFRLPCRRSITCSTAAGAVILMSHLGRPKGERILNSACRWRPTR